MKKIIVIVLVILLAVAGWFGYKEIRRASLLSSGDQLLLVRNDKSSYTFSDEIMADNIDRSWDIIGKVDSLSSKQMAKSIEGIDRHQESTVKTIKKESDIQIPTSEEAEKWQEVLTTLLPAQKERCESIESLDYAQYCFVTHYINELVKQQSSEEKCDSVFIKEYQVDCKNALQAPDQINYPDSNGNTIIDFFEEYRISDEDSASFSEQPGVIN